jgi:hypothetical protein
MGYYLADGIYPSWATFVKTIPEPQGMKKKYFAEVQEACRKDVCLVDLCLHLGGWYSILLMVHKQANKLAECLVLVLLIIY